MKLILSFLILIGAIAFAQDNKKVRVAKESEFPALPPWELAKEADRANRVDILYKVLSNDEIYAPLIGDEATFKEKMKNPQKVKILQKALLKDEKYAHTLSNLLSDEDGTKLSKIDSIPNSLELELDEKSKAKLGEIIDKMVANGDSDEDIRFVVNNFKLKYRVKKSEALILDNVKKSQLDSNIKIMLSNGATDDDVFAYVADFKMKYGYPKSGKSTNKLNVNFQSKKQIFIIYFKRLALPIITIIVLVLLSYKLLKNMTVTKIKTVLKSNNANKIYKIAGLTVFVSAIVLCYTNPTLREFKEIAPSKLAIQKDYGLGDEDDWKLAHTKVKNCIFYSYYKFSFGCSDYNRARKKMELIEYKEYYYIGIFNNFYRVEYP
jgi:hypothetical protein